MTTSRRSWHFKLFEDAVPTLVQYINSLDNDTFYGLEPRPWMPLFGTIPFPLQSDVAISSIDYYGGIDLAVRLENDVPPIRFGVDVFVLVHLWFGDFGFYAHVISFATRRFFCTE